MKSEGWMSPLQKVRALSVQQRTQIKQIKPMFYYKEETYLLLNVG